MRFIVAACVVLTLTACGTPSAEKQVKLSNKTEQEADKFLKEKGAAIAFRAMVGKNLLGNPAECGSVALRRVDGKQQFETVRVNTGSGFRLFKGYSAKDPRDEGYRIKFEPIKPGKYIVTALNCDSGYVNPPRLSDGTDIAVAGANTITIGSGELVDAGTLDFKANFSGRGFLVSYPSESAYRAMVRKNMPNVYSRISFKTFAPSGL